MKIFTLQSIPDLKEPVGPNDFASRDKYESKTSLVVTFDERFPIKKDMPINAKQLAEHESIAHLKKKLIDMSYNDAELLKIAFHHAINNAEVVALERKRDHLKEIRRKDEMYAMLSEISGQKYRIFMQWIERFQMAKMFEELKIKSLDDFKILSHHFHTHADKTHKVQLQEFLRQFGLDPSSFPTPMKYAEITGKDRLILREKAEDERVKLIDLSDVRLRMAQLQAASHIAHQEATHRAITEHVQKLYSDPSVSEQKLKAIKK
jgi:hypothetical protein